MQITGVSGLLIGLQEESGQLLDAHARNGLRPGPRRRNGRRFTGVVDVVHQDVLA